MVTNDGVVVKQFKVLVECLKPTNTNFIIVVVETDILALGTHFS